LPLLELPVFSLNILPIHLSITSSLQVLRDYCPAKIHHFIHKTAPGTQKLKTDG